MLVVKEGSSIRESGGFLRVGRMEKKDIFGLLEGLIYIVCLGLRDWRCGRTLMLFSHPSHREISLFAHVDSPLTRENKW